jgi:thiazole synthase
MWQIGGKSLTSRLFIGTAQYPSLQIMQQAIKDSGAEVLTVALKRQNPQAGNNFFWEQIKTLGCHILPNTAGCRTAQEAVTIAEISRELFSTNWIKIEVTGDDYTLQPDPWELLTATKILVEKGFIVFPYCTDDLVLAQRLVDAGCDILMPGAAPIGSAKGLLNPFALEILRTRLPQVKLIIDAGIGRPSHAVQAMELGFDAILLNTAIALAQDPLTMAAAFRDAIHAGHTAFTAGLLAERNCAHPSTPLLETPFWQ